jgi:hypothetical protein
MLARDRQLSFMRRVCSAALLSAVALAAVAADSPGAGPPVGLDVTGAGTWQSHTYDFQFMGFTSTYSCDGLADKLKVLLKAAGAGPDPKVSALCSRGYGVPDKLARATVVFSTLQPVPVGAGAAVSVAGVWRHVELAPHRPFTLGLGDCELVEQFRDKVLPMFLTRNLNNQVTCVPHEDSGSNFNLSFDVFAPEPVAVKHH